MTGYKITPEQAEQLKGQPTGSGTNYYPVQDINGDWFIFDREHDCCGLGTEAEFVPLPETEIL